MKQTKLIFLIIPLFFIFCGTTSVNIQTQWDQPEGSKIRIIDSYRNEIVQESTIPTIIPLKKLIYNKMYYVEILTVDNKHLYGELEILNITKITELSNVKIEITSNIVSRVLDNQVSKITVNDPSAERLILELRLGNRMPPAMQKIYENKEWKKL